MAAIDFFERGVEIEPKPELRNAIIQAAFKRGLLLLGCGESAIRFSPALVVSKAQIDTALEIVEAAIGEVQGWI
jgi:4-aminobutyrate aminotransferase